MATVKFLRKQAATCATLAEQTDYARVANGVCIWRRPIFTLLETGKSSLSAG